MKISKNNSKKSFEAMHLSDHFEDTSCFRSYYQLDVFEVIWIKEGSGFFSVDFDRIAFSDNTLYFLLPGQIHQFESEKDLTGYRIAFSEDFVRGTNPAWSLPALLNYTGGREKLRVANLTTDAQSEIEEIITMMLWEYNNENQLKTDILHGLLKLLIAHLSGKFRIYDHTRSTTQVYQIYHKFMDTLENRYMTYKQVSDYAEELAVSASYLSEVVKRVTGFPASYHIQQRVLLEAKRKVLCKKVPMKQIAFDLGYEDPSTFSKFFKTYTGGTFSDFRMLYAT
jgi:AraC family transcriptional activator of pobA